MAVLDSDQEFGTLAGIMLVICGHVYLIQGLVATYCI